MVENIRITIFLVFCDIPYIHTYNGYCLLYSYKHIIDKKQLFFTFQTAVIVLLTVFITISPFEIIFT